MSTKALTAALAAVVVSTWSASDPPPAPAASAAPGAVAAKADRASFGSGFRSRRVRVNGIRIHFQTAGRGEPLLLIHGFPQTSYAWRRVAPRFAANRSVVVPDLRGHGDSSHPRDGYDTAQLADDMFALMRRLGHEGFEVAGHDFGGAVAYALAAQHPDAVEQLSIIEAAPPAFGQTEGQLAAPQAFWFVWLARQGRVAEALIRGRERQFLTPLFRDYSRHFNRIRGRELDEYVRGYRQPGGITGSLNLYRRQSVSERQNREFLRTPLSMPILGVGARDSFPNIGEVLRPAGPNVTGVVIPNANHFVLSDNPRALTRALRTFFDSDEGRAGPAASR